MKFHANPKLLVATGALCISGLFALTAQASVNSAQLQELNQNATLEKGATFSSSERQKNLLNLLGRPISNSSKAAVCGDSEPDAGEECDDGNVAAGDGCSATCTVEVGSDCTAAIAGSSTENLLDDGSFEDGNIGGSWTSLNHSLFGPDLICGDSCFGTPFAAGPNGDTISGNYLLLAGGSFDSSSTGNATHSAVAIPATATTLEFQWATLASGADGDPCAGATDGLALSINAVQVWSNTDATGTCENQNPYERVVIDMTPYLNTTINFEFTGSATGIPPNVDLTNVMLDDVSVNVPAVPVIPPVPSSCLVGVCGDGVFSSLEECDDGNTAGGDGCSAGCTIEQPDFLCSDPTVDAFDFLAGNLDDAISEGSLEDNRGRFTFDWDEVDDGGNNFPPICSEVFCGPALANTGAFYAWFGGLSNATNSAISQTVTIPADATELTFEMLIGICDSAADNLSVTIDGNEVFNTGACAATPVYAPQSADITAFADGGDHLIEFRGITNATNGGNTNIFVDDISIPLTTAASGPSVCVALDEACTPIEQFSAGIPANWTVINTSFDPADGWGTTGDGICAAFNWSGIPDDNVTTGAGTAACADSDATGQADIDGGGTETEMDTYLCTNLLDLTNVTAPRFSFNANFQSADTDFNDNGTPGDTSDDFDDDLLEVLVGNVVPNALTVVNDTLYTRLGGVNDHLAASLALTGAQELSANLEGTALEGSTGYVCLRYRATYSWFAQIDNAGVRSDTSCVLPPVDTDGDGVFDSTDNCTNIANPGQEDSNADGFGNICDQDVTNTCTVTFLDYAPITQPGVLFSSTGNPNFDPDLDFDSNGIINFLDVGKYPAAIFAPPGPSANDCVPGLGN